jgi:hypothetical protein
LALEFKLEPRSNQYLFELKGGGRLNRYVERLLLR